MYALIYADIHYIVSNFCSHHRAVARYENPGGARSIVVGITYPPGKGQLILLCPYEMIVSSKIPGKLFPEFLP